MKNSSDNKIIISTIKYQAVILLGFLCSEAVLLLVFLSDIKKEMSISIAIIAFIIQIICGIVIIKRLKKSNKDIMSIDTVSSLAHDLKSPLASSRGFIQAIKDGTISDKDREKYLDVVTCELDRMSGYITSVNEMAKLSSDNYVISNTQVDINKIIVETLISLEKRIEEKDVEIKGIDNEKKLVYADINLVSRAVYNLIDNAVKYVNKKGYISFELINTETNIILYIENSGKGMTKQECDNIFDRFYRTNSAKNSNEKGLGLGLNITKQMVVRCGGRISVTSEPNKYVRFAVTLPK